ncbi:MAG: biotin transporter BioY [Terriglobia bacterium]
MTIRASANILLDAFLPRVTLAQNVLLVVAGSFLVALCAQISLPLPFSPVPVTGQTFAVLLLGAAYGARRSAASLILYLAAGAAGLPVFAPGGLPGVARFLGPTGGYLLAYPAAAFLLGWLLEHFPGRGWVRWLAAVLAAEAVIFAGGLAQLTLVLQTGWGETFRLGLLPFLPGELLKVALLTVSLPASWWALERRRPLAP